LSTALSHTIDQMRKDATNASVGLQQGYDFTFQAEKNLVSFSSNSQDPLAAQLGEVRAICDILFQAKINSLDGLQRERVCAEDEKGNQGDYLPEKTVTNELALLTPYQLTFRCFSQELGQVLAGFASSPYALKVKTINVEHSGEGNLGPPGGNLPPPGAYLPPTPAYQPPPQAYQPPTPAYQPPPVSAEGAEARRYLPGPRPLPPTTVQPAPAAGPPKTGLPVVLDETPLRVTIVLNVVKLARPKEK